MGLFAVTIEDAYSIYMETMITKKKMEKMMEKRD